MTSTFSILTPSFRQLGWLRRCVRSVEDQGAVVKEHIIQDGGTGPELESSLRDRSKVSLYVEKDHGMYDALNRALTHVTGDFFAMLNCDEQYLPGTLDLVAQAFADHPEADAIAGDFLVLDPDCQLIAFRKATPPRAAMIETDHLYTFTCALFYRRRVLESGVRFDPTLRSIADGAWVADLLRRGHRFAILPEYLSVFVFTGDNVSAQEISRQEERRLRARVPRALRLATPVLRAVRRLEKWKAGGYRSGPISYAVFAGDDDETRTAFVAERPDFRYPAVAGTP
ncbi:MAG: glycosyltransferase [Chthoniobacteraceae bacterium]